MVEFLIMQTGMFSSGFVVMLFKLVALLEATIIVMRVEIILSYFEAPLEGVIALITLLMSLMKCILICIIIRISLEVQCCYCCRNRCAYCSLQREILST